MKEVIKDFKSLTDKEKMTIIFLTGMLFGVFFVAILNFIFL